MASWLGPSLAKSASDYPIATSITTASVTTNTITSNIASDISIITHRHWQ